MAGGVRPDSSTGVLLSVEERREVMSRLRKDLYNRVEEIGGQQKRTNKCQALVIFINQHKNKLGDIYY